MIFTERTITVVNDSATINKPLILYRGDKNIELKITIAESQFKFRNTDASNVIETTDASYAQLVINTPYNSPIFSDVAATKNGAVIFVITEAMIDEIREVGAYEIQIRLLDDNKQSRASIPPVSNAIEIREPIAIEDGSAVDSNVVNVAKVNRALTTTSAPLEAFDSQGNYIKKTWGDGDPITDAALNKMEAAIDGVNKKIGNNRSQIKEIKNNMQNIGNPTDEQVKNAINEAIANGDIIAGGLTSTAQTLLISILRNAVFTSNQSENITLLQSELAKGNSGGGSETTKYTITNTLNNATTSNSAVLVDVNSSYTATIRENDGYTLDTITVTMGGTDITSSVVSGTTITIASVTGNVVITVTTTESGSSSGGGGTTELPQDRLTAFFDMRNATIEKSYNQAGWGNVAKATVSSCSEYYMFNNAGDYITDDYGIANWGIRGIRQSANTTTKLSIDKLNNSIIGLVYGNCICGLYNMTTTTNIGDEILFTPTYVNKSGSKVNLPSVKVNARNYKDLPGYSLYAITQSPTEIKLYIDGQLKHTANVSECTDFDHWVNTNDDKFMGCHFGGASNYTTACAFYNKTLSDVEVVEATEYFKTLEVK